MWPVRDCHGLEQPQSHKPLAEQDRKKGRALNLLSCNKAMGMENISVSSGTCATYQLTPNKVKTIQSQGSAAKGKSNPTIAVQDVWDFARYVAALFLVDSGGVLVPSPRQYLQWAAPQSGQTGVMESDFRKFNLNKSSFFLGFDGASVGQRLVICVRLEWPGAANSQRQGETCTLFGLGW